ncbi:uncharacterized protein FIBRA_06954 [Fibroporia radiculosa]|uniref:F-box domain-containing protein n=1 Tax=Fibroporia radiculosa TaxID=599839 RepID=J4H4C7_9APHY|nr:uncharacterized protein FIBRA_06954 [Fibroporia radiculosa]CCM04764.1 predicted protein [Fibroporia radiculosa]
MAAHPSSTLFMPITSPPTPAPSPRLKAFEPSEISDRTHDPAHVSRREFAALPPSLRFQYLSAILAECTPAELLFISTSVTPRLRRDFMKDLPPEITLHILGFIDDPQTLARASRVSRTWHRILDDQWLWRRMCRLHGYEVIGEEPVDGDDNHHHHLIASASSTLGLQPIHAPAIESIPSYRKQFQYAHTTTANWLHGGKLLRVHRMPLVPPNHRPPPEAPNSSIPTSVAIDDSWVVVGLANSRIHVFSARTGVLSRTLVGHDSGVWAVALVRASPEVMPDHDVMAMEEEDNYEESDAYEIEYDTMVDPTLPSTLRRALGLDSPPSFSKRWRRRSASEVFRDGKAEKSNKSDEGHEYSPKPSNPAGASDGWGQPNALVVSGGCDKELRVWDVKSGYCIYTLRGHTSTIRCLKVLHGRPIAVSGSRDRTVRVWDIQRGRCLRVLEGHEQSVRCLDVCGNRVVSGSYDCTCRVWDIDTGACLHVLRGHFHQIYAVAFDGVRIASGGLDTTVRVWDAATGSCLGLLQGHTGLVCQLQLSPTMLATGGSDGRVITFSLSPTYSVIQRLAAHDSSVTGLQLDERFLATSGNDGRVRLWRREPGRCEYVRELSEPSESVWKIAYTRETCVILCKRAGKAVAEIWSFRPSEAA